MVMSWLFAMLFGDFEKFFFVVNVIEFSRDSFCVWISLDKTTIEREGINQSFVKWIMKNFSFLCVPLPQYESGKSVYGCPISINRKFLQQHTENHCPTHSTRRLSNNFPCISNSCYFSSSCLDMYSVDWLKYTHTYTKCQ